MGFEEDARTIWCGNLSEKITYDVLYELFYQAGPLDQVRIPKDREGRPRNFAFVTYTHCESVPYAIELFKGTALYDRKLTLKWQNGTSMNGNSIPSPDVAKLLGRPLLNGGPQIDPDVEQKFLAMTNQIMINGLPPVNNYGDPTMFGSYDQHQLTGRLSVASLQGQWTSRHNPERAERRHEPYRDRGRSDRDRNDRGRDARSDGPRYDRGQMRDDQRQRQDRFPRDEPRDYRDRSRGNHSQNENPYGRGNRQHSRD